jgi:hypothetical protein
MQIRAKQVLRREIDLLKQPIAASEPEKEEEVIEPEPVVEDEKMEEVNGVTNGEVEEQAKAEEVDKEEEMSDDDDGLFSSEFDNLMDPNEFQSEMGFSENLEWMNSV